MSQVTISGAVSGIDTASMINQLVSVEQNQQTLLKTQQSAVQKRADAYASLSSALTSMGTLAADLAKTSAWIGTTASSTSTGVTATATGSTVGSLTFNVTDVAAAHSVASTSSIATTGTVIANSSITLTKSDNSTVSIAVGTGSLSDVVSGINNSGTGLVATAVKTSTGEYRLQVAASATGAASTFSLSGFTTIATDVLTQGTNATIHVGSGATAYDASSATNTFSDLVPGLSFTVSKLENNVTVSTKVDGSAVAAKVSKLVDAMNGILSDIASKTAYDTETKSGGPFTGQSTVRQLQQNLLSTVSNLGAPGVHLTRSGKLTFDQTEFTKAFTADPAAVAEKFGYDATFTRTTGVTGTTVAVTGALKTARAGTYDVTVTQAPRAEKWQLSPGGGVIGGSTVQLTRGTTSISYTALVTDDLDDAASAINTQAAAAGLGITASVSGQNLVFTATSVGSASAFTAKLNGVAGTQVTTGGDIQGTIDGQEAVGSGNVLSLPTGEGGAVGLSLAISTTPADLAMTSTIGKISFKPGLAQALNTLVNDATASSTGSITTATDSANTEIKRYQKSIDAWDDRLANYRKSLTAQFTAMETALAKLKSSTSALSQLVNASSSSSDS